MKNFYGFFLCFICSIRLVYADSYPEVVFSHSVVKGSYAKSKVEYSGKSWVENVKGNLLLSDTLFYTPENSLSLKYISHREGDWRADVLYPGRKIQYRLSDKDILSFKVYVESSATSATDLPKIQLIQDSMHSIAVPFHKYIEDYNQGFWMDVKIPVKDLDSIEYSGAIKAVSFLQNNQSTSAEHHIYIDQIEFLPEDYPKARLTSSAVMGDVKAYGHHVHLTWQLPLSPGIRYVKIYRSEDGEDFQPVGIKPVYMQGSLDYVPQLDKEYFYKIAWVDYEYLESPFSEEVKIETKEINTDEFLDLIELAHVNYFVESFDVNSGMYMPFRMKDRALVSVKGTGYAVLSLLVGAEKDFVSRSIVLKRISRMVYFLQRAQHNEGFFPAYFNGRTGVPDYFYQLSDYDVNATASIIEALLVAREYFDKDNESEKDLRNRITALWKRVNWQKYAHPDSPNLLLKRKGYLSDAESVDVIGGVNESMNTYFLAMASPTHSLDVNAFKKSVLHIPENIEERIDSLGAVDTLLLSTEADVLAEEDDVEDKTEEMVDSIVMTSVFEEGEFFGMNTRWKSYDDDLLRLYAAFMTINPQDIQHKGVRFEEEIAKLILYRKRFDNELGVGAKSSDVWGTFSEIDSVRSPKINPAIPIGAMFSHPDLAFQSLQYLYTEYGKESFSEYGFRSWMDLNNNDLSDKFMSLNQASIAVQMENARSGFVWNLYRKIPEINELYNKLFEHAE